RPSASCAPGNSRSGRSEASSTRSPEARQKPDPPSGTLPGMGARTLEVADGFEANELFGRNGWTAGLPIVPPTPELARVALGGGGPNAVIGRALRLVLINLLGCVPGVLDHSTLGHPGKVSFCVAEDEEGSPWVPLAQERGVPEGVSAVTVLACAPPRQVMN